MISASSKFGAFAWPEAYAEVESRSVRTGFLVIGAPLWLIVALVATAGWSHAIEVTCADGNLSQVACVENGDVVACDAAVTEFLSYFALPEGSGPFPSVLYNHGGSRTQLGGDPVETIGQLACSGYIGYAKRRVNQSLPDSYGEVVAGLAELESLAGEDLDPNHMAIMGYSRGGLLSLRMTELEPGRFAAAVLMASAPGAGGSWEAPGGSGNTTMDSFLEDVDQIDPNTAFLVIVAANDNPEGNNPFNDLVDLSTTVHAVLAERVNTAVLDIRSPWPPSNLNLLLGGHHLFESVADGGQALRLEEEYYWRQVIAHLDAYLAEPAAAPGF